MPSLGESRARVALRLPHQPHTTQAPLLAGLAAAGLGGRAACRKIVVPKAPPQAPPSAVAVRVDRGVRPAARAERRVRLDGQ